MHLNGEETLNYIRAYAVHFELHQHIQLGTQLREIRRSQDGKWHLSLLQGQEPLGRDFDKVLFCTGNTHTARIPDIIGRELFDGRILHSQAFKGSVYSNGSQSVLEVIQGVGRRLSMANGSWSLGLPTVPLTLALSLSVRPIKYICLIGVGVI